MSNQNGTNCPNVAPSLVVTPANKPDYAWFVMFASADMNRNDPQCMHVVKVIDTEEGKVRANRPALILNAWK
ncbi:MAG: hypothetical protein IT286_05535 [Proteobacteria bacterium]|jgi:hypothetical protein|nr:hypothetical protein [Pseudomonadota bacterium]